MQLRNFGLILIFLGAVIGYCLGKFSNAKLSTAKTVQSKPIGADPLRDKLIQITEVDLQEYRQLKDMRQKYEKADDILGKILLLFISDLGLKVNRHQFDILANAQSENPAPGTTLNSTLKSTDPIEKSDSKVDPAQNKDAGAAQERIQALTKLDSKISELKNADDIDKFLNDARIENLATVFSSFVPVHSLDGVLNEFLGSFVGETKLYVEDLRSLPTAMMFAMDGGKIRFNIRVEDSTMYKTDFVGTASIDSFFNTLGDSKQALYLSADQYSYRYFQLYYVPSLRMLIGNFYKKWDKPGEFKAIGSVKLTKR